MKFLILDHFCHKVSYECWRCFCVCVINRPFFLSRSKPQNTGEGSGSRFGLIVKIKQTYSGNPQRHTQLNTDRQKMNIICDQKTIKTKSCSFSDSPPTFTESN